MQLMIVIFDVPINVCFAIIQHPNPAVIFVIEKWEQYKHEGKRNTACTKGVFYTQDSKFSLLGPKHNEKYELHTDDDRILLWKGKKVKMCKRVLEKAESIFLRLALSHWQKCFFSCGVDILGWYYNFCINACRFARGKWFFIRGVCKKSQLCFRCFNVPMSQWVKICKPHTKNDIK